MSTRTAFKVYGDVQGVFFRYVSPEKTMISPDLNRYCSDFTRKRAAEYDVTGWVRNTVDGCVEGQAQGKEESVEKLLQDLKQGPPAAQVMKLEKSTVDTLKEESRFSVVR